MTGPSQQQPETPEPVTGEVERDLSAAGEALARARAAARARGLRPGIRARRDRRDVPVDARSTAGRDPHLLGEELESFVVARGWQADIAVGAVLGRWPAIVGAEVARHCVPVDFTEGVLTLRADSTAWATQLRMLASSLLTRLTAEVGEGTVREIRVLGPSAPTWGHGAWRSPDSRGPRDTYG